MGGASSVSISPNFLCLSFGTWTIEASYRSAAKLKFKAAFDVKEYGEQRGTGRARWDKPEAGLEMQRRSCCTPTVCQSLDWVP